MSPYKRFALLKKVQKGASVRDVCIEAGISRKTFYKWKKRFDKKAQNTPILDVLKDQKRGGLRRLRSGKTYYKEFSHDKIVAILNHAAAFPLLSAPKLAGLLGEKLGHEAPGAHGVQNVLKRHNLNTIAARQTYQQTQVPSATLLPGIEPYVSEQIIPVTRLEQVSPQELPAPPPISDATQIKPAFETVAYQSPQLAVFKSTQLKSKLISLLLYTLGFGMLGFWVNTQFLLIVSSPNPIGLIFATFALTFGFFFFVYSIKYYISIALVLLFSRRGKSTYTNERAGLLADLSEINLTRKPFVSIHLPLFNEKKVVNRLLQSITSMDYPNYEVIVLDDSTDETKAIVGEWRNHPLIKIVHRETRSGFKGGALNEALKVIHPETEFILIFDADFLPYPDTINQFLKYFQKISPAGDLRDFGNFAAIQGYQWHVLNKSENWITRGVRGEYSGSYVIERSSAEIYRGLKQIAGSVFMIRADILKDPKYAWGTSITEDFELTLKLYRDGLKVIYTPYIQTPSECVSTLKRLVRQRMRWAEGHSFNIRKYFRQLLFGTWVDGDSQKKQWISSRLSLSEKLEFLYLAPYYLQSFFFIFGTFCWFISEAVFKTHLPYWTEVLGWSMVLTNLLSLPLMNIVGLFLEESEEKDYAGIPSFILLSYILAPFQAYASLKGFLEVEEGPWFRTPKTGRITDVYRRSGFYKWFSRVFTASSGSPQPKLFIGTDPIKLKSGRQMNNYRIGSKVVGLMLTSTILLSGISRYIPAFDQAQAADRVFVPLHENSMTKDTTGAEENPLIRNPLRLHSGSGQNQPEYIFHREPRVRMKLGGKEIDVQIAGIDGKRIGAPQKSIRQKGKYVYEDLYNGIDLEYLLIGSNLSEQLILDRYVAVNSIQYDLRLTGLTPALRENEIYFASADSGLPVVHFTQPFLYEKAHPEEKSYGIEYKLEKTSTGYVLSKEMTNEGRLWLQDPKRNFPVVIDPSIVTSIIEDNTVTSTNANYGGQQRKLVYADTASGGAAWYAVYQYSNNIFFEKCKVASGCNENSDWTNATNIGGNDGDNVGPPSLWWEADRDKIWVVWADNSEDNAEFVDIDVTSSDPGTVGTICDGQDQRDHVPSTWLTTIAVANDDDIFITYNDGNGSGDNAIWKVPSGVCDGDATAWTGISTGSGVTAADYPVVVTMGNEAHIVFSDGNLSHSVTKDDGGTLWDTANTTISTNVSKLFSVATDGTDLWVITDQSTTGADLWTCTNCTSSVSWSDSSDPWTSQSNDIGEISIGYSVSTNRLVAFAVRSDTNDTMIAKGTDADSISWESELSISNFGVTGTGLVNLSSVMTSATDEGIAASIYDSDNTDYEFATVPENIWVLLATLPLFSKSLKKWRSRKLWKRKQSRY